MHKGGGGGGGGDDDDDDDDDDGFNSLYVALVASNKTKTERTPQYAENKICRTDFAT
jgi:hypothetical protein